MNPCRQKIAAMNINNEEEARTFIAQWQAEPHKAQLKNLKLAVESLELSQMYYEQKGKEQAAGRAEACICILSERIRALEGA